VEGGKVKGENENKRKRKDEEKKKREEKIVKRGMSANQSSPVRSSLAEPSHIKFSSAVGL